MGFGKKKSTKGTVELFCSVSIVHLPQSSILMTTLKAGYLGCFLHFSNSNVCIAHFPFTSMSKGKTRVIHQLHQNQEQLLIRLPTS